MKQQLVDPFIASAQPRRAPGASQPRSKLPSKAKTTQSRRGSIDGVVRTGRYRPPAGPLLGHFRPTANLLDSSLTDKARQVHETGKPQPVQAYGRQKTEPKPAATESEKPVSTWALLLVLVVAGLAVFWVYLGQLALLVYAVFALWKRWPSRQTFMGAMLMFGGIVIVSLLPALRYLSENLAVYAFLLLCIGTVSLALETRRDMRQTSTD